MTTRILYVITKANWGGAQRYVYDLAVAAKKNGYEVAVAYGEPGLLKDKLDEAGIRSIGIPRMRNKASLVAFANAYRGLREVFRTEKPDIVHLNSSLASAAGALAARTCRISHILFTAHGWAFNEDRSWMQKIIIRFFSWITVLLAHQIIAVSEAIQRDVKEWPGIGRRIVVVRNGIECLPLLSREDARATLAPRTIGRYWVGMLSELNSTKRVEDAIRAFSIIVQTHPEAILIVLGEGREREKLQDLIRTLRMNDHVSLPGFRGDASSLLKAFDLFVHTSRSEALGYAILEAGCARLPVVATRVGGIPEIILDDDYGLLVPAYSPEAIAEAIESLMQNPQRAAELGARLHARVDQAFSKEKMVSETFALYTR